MHSSSLIAFMSSENTELKSREIWYRNGMLSERQFYRDGLRDGERKAWYDSGQLFVHEYFRAGVRNGRRTTWHSNGVPEEREFYRDGWLDGERRSWHKNGQLRIRQLYFHGESHINQGRNPIHQEFDMNGVAVKFHFSNNRLPEIKIGISRLKKLSRNRRVRLFDTVLIFDLAKHIFALVRS